MREPVLVHRAQALCYAWIYLDAHDLEKIDIQMTYAHLGYRNDQTVSGKR